MPDLGKAVYTLYTDGTPFNAGMAAAEARAKTATMRIGSTLKKTGTQMIATGKTMSKAFTIPLIAAGAIAGKLAIDFDTSFSKIQSLVGASDKQMEQYKDHIMELGHAGMGKPTELADALFFIASAGFKGAAAVH